MSLKILWFTDPHLRSRFRWDRDPHPRWGTSGLARLANSLAWVVNLAQEQRPDLVVFGGDMMDRSSTDYLALSLAHDTFLDLRRVTGLPPDRILALVGNHDMGSDLAGDHALYSMGHVVDVVDTATMRELEDGTRLKLVPYMGREAYLQDRVHDMEADLAMMHVGVEALELGGGHRFGPWTFEDFKAPFVVGGHYHKPRVLYGGRLIYTGALCPKNFSDHGDHPFGASTFTIRGPRRITHQSFLNPHASRYIKTTEEDLRRDRGQAQHWTIRNGLFLELSSDDPLRAKDWLQEDHPGLAPKVVKIVDTGVQGLVAPPEEELDLRGGALDEVMASFVKDTPTRLDRQALLDAGLEVLSEAGVTSGQVSSWDVLRIRAEGFLSVQRMDLTIPDGVTVVRGINKDDGGSNGAGKSSVSEAIHFALYGRTIRDVGTLDEVINRDLGGCLVEVTMANDQGQVLTILRTRKHKRHGSKLQVTLRGARGPTDLSRRKKRETQAVIDGLVGVSPEIFRTVALLSPRTDYVTDSTEAERSESFLGFLDIGLDDALILAKDQRKAAKSMVVDLRTDRDRFEMALALKRRGLEGELRALRTQERQETLDDVMAELAKLRQRRADARTDAESAPVDESSAQEELRDLEKSWTEIRSQMSHHNALHQSRSETLRRRVDSLEEHDSRRCPTCLTELAQDTAERLIREAKAELAAAAQQIRQIKHSLEERGHEIHDQTEAVRERLTNAREINSRRTRAQAQLESLQSAITTLERRIHEHEHRSHDLVHRIQDLEAQLTTLDQETWDRTEELEAWELREAQLDFWAKGFSRRGLPAHMLHNLVGYANERLQAYLTKLTGGLIQASFSLKAGKGVVLSCWKDRQAIGYGNLSDGQQTCVDVAAQLSFHDVAQLTLGGLRLLIVDEAVSHLDTSKASRVIEVLRAKIDGGPIRAAFWISHRTDIQVEADSWLTATLHKGLTTYTTGKPR